MTQIAPNTVLPAHREAITLVTADDKRLVGELALPEHQPPRATLICVHPNPTGGGMMDSHLYRKAAWRLPALADVAVLRFNTRGTTSAHGTSEGQYDQGGLEGLDLAAALRFAVDRDLPRIWLVGWSFGTDVVLRHGNVDPVAGAVLVSPPLMWSSPSDLDAWAASRRPLLALVPELDDYLRPDAARQRFSAVPQCEVVAVPECQHLWIGEKFVRIAWDEVLRRVRPDLPTLTWTWDGPSRKWDDLKGALV